MVLTRTFLSLSREGEIEVLHFDRSSADTTDRDGP
jgi:hypothetical protein